MTFRILMMIFAFAATATAHAAAELSTIRCKENYDPRHEVIRARTTVTIEELEDITNSDPLGRKFDNVYRIHMRIETKLNGRTTIERDLVTKATAVDVHYQVNDRREGVSFRMYLDELDQSGIEYLDSQGRLNKVNLICETL